MEKHPLHIKIPELQKSEEVQDAVEKQERLEEEKLPNDAGERIESYMSRLENIFLNKDSRVKERNLEMLRENIYDAFIIKPENVPDSYFELQQQIMRERGQPVEVIPDATKRQMIETIIEDQKHSLDSWIDYLTSEDAVYPTWFKYFVFRNITKLSQFDKTLGKFKERTEKTTAPFPDIFREPLAQICDVYEQVARDNKSLKDEEIQKIFSRKFPTVYAEKIQESLAASIENKEGIEGEWIKYEQGKEEDSQKLYDSLQSKGTGWCTAGISTAQTQIENGDFYVYYTYDKQNQPTQPRIAIRMNGTSEIGEVRGVLEHQALEPQMSEVLEKKLSEFGPEADKYKKKSADMRKMTEVEKKTKEGAQLSKEELEFLYEINSKIEGFGYKKDPRIEEIRKQRNVKEDLPVLFECEENQIATDLQELNENTKAYVGKWGVDIYKEIKQYSNIKHHYESFPDKKIFMMTLETDPSVDSPEKAEEKLKEKGMHLYNYAKDILYKTEFSKENKSYQIVSFSVAELGFPNGATLREIYEKAQSKEVGLELCPAEVGPQLRLKYEDQPSGEYLRIAMEAISGREGDPVLFIVYRGDDKLWLHYSDGDPDFKWRSDPRFVFLSRKD